MDAFHVSVTLLCVGDPEHEPVPVNPVGAATFVVWSVSVGDVATAPHAVAPTVITSTPLVTTARGNATSGFSGEARRRCFPERPVRPVRCRAGLDTPKPVSGGGFRVPSLCAGASSEGGIRRWRLR